MAKDHNAQTRAAARHPCRSRGAALLALAALLASCASAARRQPQANVIAIDPTPWIRDLDSDDLFVSEPAMDKLSNLGDAALPALAAAYQTGSAQQRLNIMEVTRDIGTPRAAALLARGVDDADDEVRDEAFSGLAALADPATAPAVERAVFEQSDRPSRAAVTACVELCRSPATLERLFADAVRAEPVNKHLLRAGGVRRLCADAARAAAANAALDAVVVPALQDPALGVRARAALLLAERTPDSSVPVLLEYARHGENSLLRYRAFLAIGESGDASVVEPLAALSRNPDRLQARLPCAALVRLQQRGVTVAPRDFDACAQPASAAGAAANKRSSP